MDAQGGIVTFELTAKKGESSWKGFGKGLERLMTEMLDGEFRLMAGLANGVNLSMKFVPAECVKINDGLFVLKVLPGIDENGREVDERTEQLIWREDEVNVGDEMPVLELTIVKL